MTATQVCTGDAEGVRSFPEGRIVQVPDRGSFFARCADGRAGAPAVVLLHGLGATADLNWASTIPALSGAFRVVAPDLRGHGRAATNDRFTLEDAAEDVAAIADGLSLGPIILVGYSMGGAIAQLVCRQHPDKVRGLVLCATSGHFVGTWRERLILLGAFHPMRIASRAVPGDVARATARRIASHVGSGGPDHGFTECDRTFDVSQVLEALCALGNFRSDAWIGEIDVPSAVLVHLRDRRVPPSRQFQLAHALPRAVVHPIDCDHIAVVTKPRAFVSAVVHAVRDVDRRGASRDDRNQSVNARPG